MDMIDDIFPLPIAVSECEQFIQFLLFLHLSAQNRSFRTSNNRKVYDN